MTVAGFTPDEPEPGVQLARARCNNTRAEFIDARMRRQVASLQSADGRFGRSSGNQMTWIVRTRSGFFFLFVTRQCYARQGVCRNDIYSFLDNRATTIIT